MDFGCAWGRMLGVGRFDLFTERFGNWHCACSLEKALLPQNYGLPTHRKVNGDTDFNVKEGVTWLSAIMFSIGVSLEVGTPASFSDQNEWIAFIHAHEFASMVSQTCILEDVGSPGYYQVLETADRMTGHLAFSLLVNFWPLLRSLLFGTRMMMGASMKFNQVGWCGLTIEIWNLALARCSNFDDCWSCCVDLIAAIWRQTQTTCCLILIGGVFFSSWLEKSRQLQTDEQVP